MDPETEDPFIDVEASVPPSAADSFRTSGFTIVERLDLTGDLGHSHMIRAGRDGFDVGSDPRADGSAAAG
jgi:hypothetical protein